MHILYIIFSRSLDKYYVGETESFQIRLTQHNTGHFKNSSTSVAQDWEEYLLVPCMDRSHARRVELFIKKQKSRVFIESLKLNPEKVESIVNRFK